MKLEDGFEVGWFAEEAFLGHYVLAVVVALGWAGPEEEFALERC